MPRHPEIEDLTLIVRALHRDVSALDERLRALEETIRVLRERAAPPELFVVARGEGRGA